jgi:hypothetical protein
MLETAEVLLILLYIVLFGMLLLAILFLRQRQMTRLGYICWGIFALIIPVVGPFFVIAYRPGFPQRKDQV